MDFDDLIVDIQRIPLDTHNREENLELLLKHAEYLSKKDDIGDEDVQYLVTRTSEYIQMQVKRLQLHFEAEIDIIAWISRGLMELYFVLRYVYSSPDRMEGLIKEYFKDTKVIEKIISKRILQSDTPEVIDSFNKHVKNYWKKLGVKRDELKRPKPANYFAKKAKLSEEYHNHWIMHSKYVHPTSYLLFGDRNIVYGSDYRKYFWQHAQYYAARNLRDLHKLIEASKKN